MYRRSRIVTPSESARDEIVSLLHIPRPQIDVVHNGLGHAFSPGGTKTAHPSIVAVARLVPVKRHDLLIRAAAVARQQVPDLTLTIVGEGYEREALDAVIRELDAEPWVHLTGRVDETELVRLYREAWVAASASAREGWGLSLTEAAACGTPAVATQIAGHADAVHDGVSGVLAPGTVDALGGAGPGPARPRSPGRARTRRAGPGLRPLVGDDRVGPDRVLAREAERTRR